MVHKTRKSKRRSLKDKYKIDRKVKEHHRKLRREAKKHPELRKKLKKDPGLPNLYPFKEQFLEKIENQRAKLKEEQDRQKEQRFLEQQKRRNVALLAADANYRNSEFTKKMESKEEEEDKTPSHLLLKDGSRRAYFREFKKIVETADVILEVLDARDPLGCRCPDVERRILAKDPNKKIILVLNKVDLIPKENVEAWLKYLRREYPTIAFKCSTQEQSNLSQNKMSTDVAPTGILKSSECLGADTLLQLLKNYSRNLKLKTSVYVGIIGYPNVGKSSLINSLKRSKAVGVGSTPGFTKTVQEVHLDKNVKLLDCPGIVFGDSVSDADIILRNAVKIEQVPDPVEPVEAIVKRCRPESLSEIYKIPGFSSAQEFLLHLAHKFGKLKKGGAANLHAVALQVLRDWNGGKIPFFTVPPIQNNILESVIVSNWAKEFDVDAVFAGEKNAVISQLPEMRGAIEMIASNPTQSAGQMFETEMEEEEESSEEEEEISTENSNKISNNNSNEIQDEMEEEEEIIPEALIKMQKNQKKGPKQDLKDEADILNPQINKMKKKNMKKLKKFEKKMGSKKGKEEEEYDFATDFFGGNNNNNNNGKEEEDEEEDEGELGLGDI